MGLLTKLNETSLRSLRYGKDRIGGGSSNQPYITKPIPDGESSLGNTGGPDFLLRGGTLAVTSTANDVSRLAKMFFDFKSPNGALFIAKQNLLTRLGVKTQAGGQEIYLPSSTLAQAGVSAFGLHFYKQGLNPIPIPSSGPIISLGPLGAISPTGNIISYSQVVPVGSKTPNDNTTFNRLYQLFDVKILGNFNIYSGNNISPLTNGVLQYGGGPGSILGIGKTNISFSDQRTNTYDPVKYLRDAQRQQNYLTLSYNGLSVVGDKSTYIKKDDNELSVTANRRSVDNLRTSPGYVPKVIDFRVGLRQTIKQFGGSTTTLISNSPSYDLGEGETIETRVNLGDPGNKTGKNLISYVSGSGIGPVDKITAKPLYQSEKVDVDQTNDLVKFRIEAINNDTPEQSVFMHFRAFLDSFSDAYNATWNPTRFVGRGEELYTYGGFTRGISIGWTVAAQSKEELIPMYQKLNYLASNLTPDYSKNGYMRGPLMRLTVGGYLYSQPGFITNLTYTIDDNSPWEIGINERSDFNESNKMNIKGDNSVKELPHVMKVSMNYTPIHSFTPRKQTNSYTGLAAGQNTGNYISTFGPEHYIALSTGDHNNYDNAPNYTK